jgi:CD109 antigen
LRNATEFNANVEIEVPPNAVEDSTRIEAAAVGDLMGNSIENLDKLM